MNGHCLSATGVPSSCGRQDNGKFPNWLMKVSSMKKLRPSVWRLISKRPVQGFPHLPQYPEVEHHIAGFVTGNVCFLAHIFGNRS
jgi:hypothetical protein